MNDIKEYAQLVPANLKPEVLAKMDEISQSAEKVDKAIEAAKKAKDSAEAASKKSAGWSFTGQDKKEAIKALQQSGIEMSKGIQSVAEAQKVMFDNLQNISKATQCLFGLGAMNMATTRSVIDTITSGLQDASKQQISMKARESLMSVVQQLKAQEDLFCKVEKISNRTKELEKELSAIRGNENTLTTELSLYGLNARMVKQYDDLHNEIKTMAESEALLHKRNSRLKIILWILGILLISNLTFTIFRP